MPLCLISAAVNGKKKESFAILNSNMLQTLETPTIIKPKSAMEIHLFYVSQDKLWEQQHLSTEESIYAQSGWYLQQMHNRSPWSEM